MTKIKDNDFRNLAPTRMREAATRVNQRTPISASDQPINPPDLSEAKPKRKPKYALPRVQHAATGPSDNWRNRPTYKTGDGEVRAEPRPGSLDFLKHPSRGTGT